MLYYFAGHTRYELWSMDGGREETMGCGLPGKANLEAPMPPTLSLHANFVLEYINGCV